MTQHDVAVLLAGIFIGGSVPLVVLRHWLEATGREVRKRSE